MANTENRKQQLHVAMFPWLAFGHIIPFLHLSKFIAQKGHKVSFLSTAKNIHRLPPHLSPLINLIELKLPHVPELPENAEATMDVVADDIQYLKKAFDGLLPEVTRFLREQSPDWIIYDFAPYWLPEIAAGFGISRAFFTIINAWFIALMGSSPEDLINGSDYRKTTEDFLTPPKWVPFPTKVCYRKYDVGWMMANFTVNTSGVSDMYRMGMVLKGSDCMFIRHCYEFEPQWLTLIQKLTHRPVVPVGLLPPETPAHVGDGNDGKGDMRMTIKKWLDGQRKGRVVYVALGSEVTLTKANLAELALGLELSGLPFFWALRHSAGSSELPDGFLERTRDCGVVWTDWVPQLEILRHESVCGFLTHCGWSSIVEGLMFAHPLIMLPFMVDQGPNARIMVDNKVGIEVPRNEEDGSFTKESVASSMRSVVLDDDGKMYKANAMKLSEIFGNIELGKEYINRFIDYLEKKRHVVSVEDEP